MADGGGNGKGKVLAGCSCVSLVVFLGLTLFINFGIAAISSSAPPEVATMLASVAAFGSYLTGPCCSLSGVGLIVVSRPTCARWCMICWSSWKKTYNVTVFAWKRSLLDIPW